MADTSIRRKRIGATIRQHLSGELSRELADPRLSSLMVQSVEMTPDLTLAKVRVRLMVASDDPSVEQELMMTLGRIAPGLRSRLAPVLRMRRVPDIRFLYDHAPDERAHIREILDQVKREDEAKRAALQPDPTSKTEDDELL